jgi:septum formation protein
VNAPARRRLVLASTSRYRRELLERLRLPFDAARPEVDETPLPGESPRALVERLSVAKAAAVAATLAGGPDEAWVIGSDQAASLDDAPLGKPGDRERARAQLAAMSGRTVAFHTGVCLVAGMQPPRLLVDTTLVRVRPLGADAIERYLDAEAPYDCAGSFKSEALGIALFDAIESHDPTALVGLPLIATVRLLREAGWPLP